MLLAGPSVPAQLFGSGLIGVREGLETGIVVMVLVAFLVKSDRRDALKWVWAGVALAVAMVVGIFLVIHFGTSTVTTLTAELIAGIASLVAVPKWMTRKIPTTIATASVTPPHTHLRASRRSDLTRKATKTITTMPVSRPSRTPISPLPNNWAGTEGLASSIMFSFGSLPVAWRIFEG